MTEPQIAVVGAGTMGVNIALDFAVHGRRVTLVDAQPGQLERAIGLAKSSAELLDHHGLLSAPVAAILARITLGLNVTCTASGPEVIVEAVPEHLPLKRSVFKELEETCGAETIFASSTSTFMPSSLAVDLAHPERLLVMHYWNPAHLMPLVEVVPHSRTAPTVVDRVKTLLESCGKRPVLLRSEIPGFIGNRLAFALQREAMAIVEQGVATAEDVDAVARMSFGRRIPVSGIFRTADLGGLDVYAAICEQLFPNLCQDAVPPAILHELVGRGCFGVKTGKGWYQYTPAQAAALRTELGEELIRWAKNDRGAFSASEGAVPTELKGPR